MAVVAAATVTTEDEITLSSCTICLEDYTEPRVLPCLHTYCTQCLKEYISSKLKQVKKENCFQCPTCRRSVRCTSVSCLDELVKQFPVDTCMNILVSLEKQLKHLMKDGGKIKKAKTTAAALEDSKEASAEKEEASVCRPKNKEASAEKEEASVRERTLVCRPKNNIENMCPNKDLQMKKVISVYVEIQKKILPFFQKAVSSSVPPCFYREMDTMATETDNRRLGEDNSSSDMYTEVVELTIFPPPVKSYQGQNYRGLLYTDEGYCIVINIRRKSLVLYDDHGRELDHLVLTHEPFGMCWFGNNQIALTASYQKLYLVKLLPTNRFDLLHEFRTSIQYSGIYFYGDSHLLAIGYAEPHLKLVSLTYESSIELTVLTLPYHRLKGQKCVHLTEKGDIYIADTSNGFVYCFMPYNGWTRYSIRQPTDIVSLGNDVYISQGFGIDKILRLDSKKGLLSCFLSPGNGLTSPCGMAMTSENGIIFASDYRGKLSLGFWDEV